MTLSLVFGVQMAFTLAKEHTMVVENRVSLLCLAGVLSSLISSFLWKYADNEFHIFRWTGRNDYVALCEPSFLSFGGGSVFFVRPFPQLINQTVMDIMVCISMIVFWRGLPPRVPHSITNLCVLLAQKKAELFPLNV